jgi:hypothetical protein
MQLYTLQRVAAYAYKKDSERADAKVVADAKKGVGSAAVRFTIICVFCTLRTQISQSI